MNDEIDWKHVKQWARSKLNRATALAAKAQEFAAVAAQVPARPSPIGLLGVTASALNLAGKFLNEHPWKTIGKWHSARLRPEMAPIARAALASRLAPHPGDARWLVGEVDGQGLALFVEVSSNSQDTCLRAERDPEAALALVRAHVRADASEHVQVVPAGEGVRVVAVDAPTETASEVADAIWRRLEGPLTAGHTRVIMLAGPPGTVKSTIARTLARRACDRLRGTSMRVALADLEGVRPGAIDGMCDLVRPDVFLLDDIDRFGRTEMFLDMFERCHGRQRLVVVTVNEPRSLPDALRRPGRIDEVVTVEGVGRALALAILGDAAARLTDEQVQDCAGWPAAHVTELALRLRTIPGADPAAEVADVGARARANGA